MSTRDSGQPSEYEIQSRADSGFKLGNAIFFLPIPLFLGLLSVLFSDHVEWTFESYHVLLVLNTLFLAVLPLVVAFLAFPAYLASGHVALIMLGNGTLCLGLGSLLAGISPFLGGSPNAMITLHDTSALASGLFHLLGAMWALQGGGKRTSIRWRRIHTDLSCLMIPLFLLLLLATLEGMTPTFYVRNVGPTRLRQVVLAISSGCFGISAVLFGAVFVISRSGFASWYWKALALIATGLLCILSSPSIWSDVSWLGRIAQYVGGIYMFLAAVTAWRESQDRNVSLVADLWTFFYNRLEVLVSERTGELVKANRALSREIAAREEAEHALRVSHEKLEQRVEERTARLKLANERLAGEIALKRTAETALRESEEKFRLFMDNSPAVAWIKDAQGRRTYASRAYEKRFGVQQGDWLGKTDNELWPEEVALDFSMHDQQVLDSGHPLECNEVTIDGKGSRTYWLTNKFPYEDASGNRYVGGIGIDITERMRAEEALKEAKEHLEIRVRERTEELERQSHALRESELWMRSIFNSLEEAVLLVTTDRRIREVNPAAEKMFGYSNPELAGQSTTLFSVNREHYEIFGRRISHAFKAGKSAEFEFESKRKNGEIFPTSHSVSLLRDSEGNAFGILSVIRDLTERIRSEEMRKKALENAEFLERMFNITHFSVVILDRDFNFIRVNQAYAVTCGYPPDFFPGKNHFNLYPHAENEAIFRDVVATGRSFTVYAKPFEFPDDPGRGTTYWDWTLNPVKDELGRVEALVFVLLDVTERENAYKAVLEGERKFRLLSETIQDVFWMSTPGAGKMIYISPAYEKIWGRSTESMYESPKSFLEAVHPDDVEALTKTLDAYHAAGTEYSFEYRIIGSDGTMRWVEERGFPVCDDDGKVYLMCGVCKDISLRKRTEHLLKLRAEDLARSNRDLEQFAYVASHDLQEPLRNIAGCLQLLEKKYKNKLDSDADKYIYYAVESAVRMKALIMDLLVYSRIGTRGKPLGPVDFEQILGRTMKNLASAISESQGTITHDPLPIVSGDDSQLMQVLQNLIHNAIKFRRDAPPRIHVSAIKKDQEWLFSVKDNGIGIEARHLDRIFVIFQRLHKRSEYEGTGMGLAIVKKVVERHGGRVWVESEPGAGTTFFFTIPEEGVHT